MEITLLDSTTTTMYFGRSTVLCLLISIVAIALASNSLYVTESHYDDIFDFTPLVLAIAGLTFMLVTISQPFLTRICVELVWSGFLWVCWFATAGYVTWSKRCPFRVVGPYGADPFCEVHPTLNGLSFVLALLLLGHWTILLIVGHHFSAGGQRTWNMSLKELALRAPSTTSSQTGLQETPKFEYDQPMSFVPPAYAATMSSASSPSSALPRLMTEASTAHPYADGQSPLASSTVVSYPPTVYHLQPQTHHPGHLSAADADVDPPPPSITPPPPHSPPIHPPITRSPSYTETAPPLPSIRAMTTSSSSSPPHSPSHANSLSLPRTNTITSTTSESNHTRVYQMEYDIEPPPEAYHNPYTNSSGPGGGTPIYAWSER
ncbi:hypothetical protein WG66_013912 [Moniliophthora roreri]|nr:hypothetical protein WG66_013912 [Moniliophthora roreri]